MIFNFQVFIIDLFTNILYFCIFLGRFPGKIIFQVKYYLSDNKHLTDVRHNDSLENIISPFRESFNIKVTTEDEKILILHESKIEKIKNIGIDMSRVEEIPYELTLSDVVSFCDLPLEVYKIKSETFPWKNDEAFYISSSTTFTCSLPEKE
tara:strand:- start:9537 stop:9989 length:453 start_codon:yes stop_codon:yes gene_type:complete